MKGQDEMIDITNIDLKEFAKKVYDLSRPQGLGFIHFQSGGLNEDEAQQLLDSRKNDSRLALNMDYVNGRACKMMVFRTGELLEINDNWYDHTDDQLQQLLAHFNLKPNNPKAHSVACNCAQCQIERGHRD